MEPSRKPELSLAKKVLPAPLFDAIQFIFDQEISGCALVGGTALSGFYAGHRRSDDIDLFTESETAFRTAVLAVKNLTKIGAEFSSETQSKQYYHAICKYRTHGFTIDVVLDENLFKVGKFITLKNRIVVCDLKTLLQMKAAALVSRCAEKDLYDLKWLFSEFDSLSIRKFLEQGHSIDRGMNGESLLASVTGTILREESCGFSLDPKHSASVVFAEIMELRKRLIAELVHHLENQPTPPLGQLVRKVRKILR